jgi:hypothetical protein
MEMDRTTLMLSMACMCAAAFAACSGADVGGVISPDASMHSAGKSGQAAIGSAGRGGRNAATGGGNAPGDGQATSVKCGSATCMSPAAAMGFITACCADEATSTCGTAAMGGACAKPIPDDPRCPGIDVMGVIMLPSCCSQNGMCGIDASMFGMPGCVDLGVAAKQAMSMGGGIALPSPRACDGADGGADDAGS